MAPLFVADTVRLSWICSTNLIHPMSPAAVHSGTDIFTMCGVCPLKIL